MREQDTLNTFVNFLVSSGYPQNSIAIGWPLSKQDHADLAIIDPLTKEPLAYFELKHDNAANKEAAHVKYESIASTSNVPIFHVYGEGSNIFGVKPTDNAHSKDTDKIIPYNILVQGGRTKLLATQKKEQKTTVDDFRIVCWFIAVVLLLIFFLDLFSIVYLTVSQMTLLAAVIALILFPYASKLKFLGLEFERVLKSEEKE